MIGGNAPLNKIFRQCCPKGPSFWTVLIRIIFLSIPNQKNRKRNGQIYNSAEFSNESSQCYIKNALTAIFKGQVCKRVYEKYLLL